MTDIVVTGLAWTTALGEGIDAVWARLLNGESGIGDLPSSFELKNTHVGYLRDAEGGDTRRRLSGLAESTARAALKDACVDINAPGQRNYLIVGTSLGYRLDDKTHSDDPLNAWVDEIAGHLGLKPLVLSTACSSGSDAILLGAQLLKSGVADLCVCGGADILGISKRLAHTALGTMSATALRSFDQAHDGTLLGEGAGFVVLQHEHSAERTPYAHWMGSGSSNDAAGLTAPDEAGNGIRLAINRSLAEAGLLRNQIELINAHGSGTHTNDRVESSAYKDYFAGVNPLVFATKGAFGHTLGATGALEAIALIKALQTGTVPPVFGLQNPIADLGYRVAQGAPVQQAARVGLSLTIGFGGFNTSLIFKRYV